MPSQFNSCLQVEAPAHHLTVRGRKRTFQPQCRGARKSSSVRMSPSVRAGVLWKPLEGIQGPLAPGGVGRGGAPAILGTRRTSPVFRWLGEWFAVAMVRDSLRAGPRRNLDPAGLIDDGDDRNAVSKRLAADPEFPINYHITGGLRLAYRSSGSAGVRGQVWSSGSGLEFGVRSWSSGSGLALPQRWGETRTLRDSAQPAGPPGWPTAPRQRRSPPRGRSVESASQRASPEAM